MLDKQIMSVFSKEDAFVKLLVILYFVIAAMEFTAELVSCKPVLFILKPLVLIMLLLLYRYSSVQRVPLFFISILFLLIAKMFAIQNTEEMLFLGMIAFFLHRVVMIYYVFKLIKLKDYIPLLIAMVPFLFFFFYLLSLTNNISTRSYYGLIIQSILMSALASMTVSHFVMNDEKKDVWLLIFGLLSVTQYFMVFIDKFYLLDLSLAIFRPLEVILTTSVCFAFYKFVITTEMSNDN
jgi:hypothetical protein